MARVSDETTLLCVVCMGGDPEGFQHRCNKCWDINEVRSYCSRCKGRTAQTPAGAKKLFSKLNDELLDDEVFRPGNVIHFLKRCPACYEPHESTVFALRVHTFDDEDEHPPPTPRWRSIFFTVDEFPCRLNPSSTILLGICEGIIHTKVCCTKPIPAL